MKNLSMQEINSITSFPAESFELTASLAGKDSEYMSGTSEGHHRVRRSAAMIGLAISMGATTVLLPKQNDKAIAAEPIASQPTMTSFLSKRKAARNVSQDKVSLGEQEKAPTAALSKLKIRSLEKSASRVSQSAEQMTAPAIKHRVNLGETIWTLSRKYQVEPGAIAIANRLETNLPLTVGQILKIPAANGILREIKAGETLEAISQTYGVETEKIRFSGDSLSPREKLSAGELIGIPGKIDYLLQQRQNYAFKDLKSKQQRLRNSLTALHFKNNNSFRVSQLLPPETEGTESESHASEISDKDAVPFQPTTRVNIPKTLYTVKPGDTLDRIAQSYGVSRAELMKLNRIDDPNMIRVNQELKIPGIALTREPESSQNSISKLGFSAGNDSLAQSNSLNLGTKSHTIDTKSPDVNSQLEVSSQSHRVADDSDTPAPNAQFNPYIEKLRADIQRLREEYQQEKTNPEDSKEPISSEPDSELEDPVSTRSQASNPDWVKERLQRQMELEALDEKVATAPAMTQPDFDREMVRIQVGGKTRPELPPLRSPGAYLPDSPAPSSLPAEPRQYLPDNVAPAEGFVWPTKGGKVTSGYGWRWGRMHKGIDIAGPVGTPIVAAGHGEVLSAGWNSGGYGNLVKLKHPDGSVTLYAHNSRLLVRKGQTVYRGQQIAEMGSTGYSTGPHLHFEIHPRGKGAVNPMAYLHK